MDKRTFLFVRHFLAVGFLVRLRKDLSLTGFRKKGKDKLKFIIPKHELKLSSGVPEKAIMIYRNGKCVYVDNVSYLVKTLEERKCNILSLIKENQRCLQV